MFFDKHPTKYVLIAGSRDFEDYRTAKKYIDFCLDDTIRVQCFFEETAPLSALLPSAHNTLVFLGRASRR